MLKEILENLDAINNFKSNIGKPLDFSKKEDIDKAKAFIDEVEDNEFLAAIIGENTINGIKEYINESYSKLKAKNTPKRPSIQTSENAKKNIAKLVEEYTTKMIFPYINKDITDKQKNEMVDSLFEFACWLYNK